MRELTRRYRHTYQLAYRFGHWRHDYQLVGAKGAVNFHVTDFGAEHGEKYGDRYSAGLEFHHRTPPDGTSEPPSHDDCWLLKAPCWHDGTSLYARESLLPLFDGVDHVSMFARLEVEADEHFGERP